MLQTTATDNITITTTTPSYPTITARTPPSYVMFDGWSPLTVKENKNDKKDPTITNVEELNPEKVYRFTFDNGKVIKTVCLDDDLFNFKFAFYLAYAKLLYGDELNICGIENKANELMGYKKYNKLVRQGMKLFEDTKKYKEKLEKEEKERKEIRRRQAEKKARKKARRRQARTDEMAEAFKKAKK